MDLIGPCDMVEQIKVRLGLSSSFPLLLFLAPIYRFFFPLIFHLLGSFFFPLIDSCFSDH